MEENESNEGFKVTDRRRFTSVGAAKEPAQSQETSETQEQPPETEPRPESNKVEPEGKTTGDQPPPPMDFSMFVVSMANTAMFQLGLVRNPETGETRKDLPGARQTINLIALLEEKTRGNLTEQEARIIKEALFQLRMAFVEVAK